MLQSLLASVVVTLFATVGTFFMVAPSAAAVSTPPCVENAIEAARYCAAVCQLAAGFDHAVCVPHEAGCVSNCKIHLDGCRATGIIEDDTLSCAASFESAQVACVDDFPERTGTAFFQCLDLARQDAALNVARNRNVIVCVW